MHVGPASVIFTVRSMTSIALRTQEIYLYIFSLSFIFLSDENVGTLGMFLMLYARPSPLGGVHERDHLEDNHYTPPLIKDSGKSQIPKWIFCRVQATNCDAEINRPARSSFPTLTLVASTSKIGGNNRKIQGKKKDQSDM